MITFDEDKLRRVHDIYSDQVNRDTVDPEMLLELTAMFNTYDVAVPILKSYVPYWEFLHSCLDNLETGFWNTIPVVRAISMMDPRLILLTENQIDKELINYRKHREEVLDKLELSSQPRNDRLILLHWLSSPNNNNSGRTKSGWDSFVGISHCLLRVYLYYTQKDLKGYNNIASLINPEDLNLFPSFTNADASRPQLIGSTKMDIIRNSSLIGGDDIKSPQQI